MFKTLYSKIALILSGLFLLVGLLYIFLTLFTTKLYVQEGAQRLNHDLARYLVSQNLFIEEGKVNDKALKSIFDMLMNINHNIEVYLLDKEGKILAFSAPEGRVKRDHVSLGPVERFLGNKEELPILGDDPRHPGREKAFSVSTIPLDAPHKSPLEGYLYVILGSEEYDSVAQMLQTNYILRLSSWVITAGLLFLFLSGLYLFNLLTRRLKKLSTSVEAFKESNFAQPISLKTKHRNGDEIDRMSGIFEEMSIRIMEQVNEIRRADAMRRELVTNVSHDLRTPLSSLQGYLETLLLKGEQNFSPHQKEYLSIALNHSHRLGKLVSELFDLSRLDAGQMEIEREPFHLAELIQDIAQKSRLAAEEKDITIETSYPQNLPFVLADIGLIERAVQNLVDNAIRHSPHNSKINISLALQDASVGISIADEGCGIAKEDVPYIFDRFYCGNKNDGERSGGTGLGLAITKGIVEIHGSPIHVESEMGKGTVFSFSLPLYKSGN